MIFRTIQRSTCIRFDLLCRIHRNKNRNKSKYLTDLLEQHASFIRKKTEYEETCLAIVWQACIRTLFRTNKKPRVLSKKLNRGKGKWLEVSPSGAFNEHELASKFWNERCNVWFCTSTRFQIKQDLNTECPKKRERPKSYYF